MNCVCSRVTSCIPVKSMILLFIIWNYSPFVPVIQNVGFYCDDESIQQPYHGDTISFVTLLGSLLCIFPLIIYISEVFSRKFRNEDSVGKIELQVLLRNYYSGFLFVLGFTEVLKFLCCELRPHFITSCVPDMKNIRCSDGLITNFNCTGKGKLYFFHDIYKSFPSGHAALSFYASVYLNVFVYTLMKNVPSSSIYHWWLRIIPVITFIWTAICCVTRILDNRHFWWDVLVGILIGMLGGIIAIKVSMKTAMQRKQNIPNKM